MEMMKKIFSKLCTREVIFYLIFGMLATLVNFVCFFVFSHVINLEENLSNIIAIIISILFAYITNSTFVFQSKCNSAAEKFVEFFKFILGRAFTMFVEIIGFFVMFNLLNINDIISKILISIVVIILNYIISKFFAFKK